MRNNMCNIQCSNTSWQWFTANHCQLCVTFSITRDMARVTRHREVKFSKSKTSCKFYLSCL